MNFEVIVETMVRLCDSFQGLEEHPDYRLIEDWVWEKAEADRNPLTL